MKHLESYSKRELAILYLQVLMDTKKIVTPELKKQLIILGFKEVVIGTKKEHKIQSKDFMLDFFGYDIAIGLSPLAISYHSERRYFAMVYNFQSEDFR